MKLRFFVLPFVFLFQSAAVSRAQEPAARPIEILSADDRGLTIEFNLRNWALEELKSNGEAFAKADFQGAVYRDDRPGSPQIPYHAAVIGIPVGASVRYQILQSETRTINGVKLLPVPRPKKVDDWLEAEYAIDEQVYRSKNSYPVELILMSDPSYFRDQQIVNVQVAGVQYLPSSEQLTVFDKIVLRVDFVGGNLQSSQNRTPFPRSEENLYKRSLLNYDQAIKWRRSAKPASLLSKTALASIAGTFYEVQVKEEGIYKIDGNFLESNGISLSEIDPAKIRLFNNGGRELPRDLDADRPRGLIENAILVEDGGDGRFDKDDYILFYGRGVTGWDYDPATGTYSHYINHYGFSNIYWLNWDGQEPGIRMESPESLQPGGELNEVYQGHVFVENETSNPLRSGMNWFGWSFATDDISNHVTYNLELPNAVAADSVKIKMRFASVNQALHRFNVSLNGNSVGATQFDGFGGQYLRLRTFQTSFRRSGGLAAGENVLRIDYAPSQEIGQAFMDWFELFYTARLQAVGNEIAFTVFPSDGPESYRISNFSSNRVQLFDVTDFSRVRKMAGFQFSNGQLTFADAQSAAQPKRYLALDPGKYKPVDTIERMDMRDLRSPQMGADFVIITHDDFYSEAQRLESFRENGNPDNRLMTEVVRISDIYNNFSGGMMDATAIRDFLKFAFDNWSPKPAYVLLFGDGDYDYKNILSRDDRNWIPTYQTDEINPRATYSTLEELVTRATDSWFTYISGNDNVMDMAIGRLNIQTLEDAQNAVNKIIAYETQPLRGNWRNTITMVGDDELVGGGRPSVADAGLHIPQAERISENYIPDYFDVEKIYLSEYPKVLSASVSGVRKPAAQEALIQQMNKGTLIVNFIGHGNANQWAHEVIFHKADDDRVQNQDKLIFFVAATCDWALYDNPQSQSQAEELLLLANRGAIAMLSSARLVFSGDNANFNQEFYRQLFPSFGESVRIGDAFVATRMATQRIPNDEKFHIFGDPTLHLAVPKQEVAITSMTPDSIVALNTIDITGEIRKDGKVWDDFNGTTLLTTFDSKKSVVYTPEAGSPVSYNLPGNTIFRGTVPVENGRFTAKFIVPKDISYGGKLARISAYVWNDETDGVGFKNQITVSSATSDLVDRDGPEIKVYFKGREDFTTGDIIGENETLVVEVADSISGVNIAGEIGHRLTLSIDPDAETCLSQLYRSLGLSNIDLTDLFQFDKGNYLSGKVEFPIHFPEEVEVGGQNVPCSSPNGDDKHTLVVKAWDNSNNSSTTSVDVVVIHEQGLVLREVMNYPNPFREKTTFSFFCNNDAEVQIKIYTIAGQLIRTLEYPFARSGFNMVEWDGRDADGDVPANGIYLYKLVAKAFDNSGMSQKEIIGRLALIR